MKRISEIFAFNLRRLRGKRTQLDVANGANATLRNYARWEAGLIPNKQKDREALARYFGVPEIDLFLDPKKVLEPTIQDIIKVITDQHARLAKVGNVSDRNLAILPSLDALSDKEFKQLLIHLKMIETARGAATIPAGTKDLKESS